MPLEVKEFLKAKTLPALRRLYKLTRNADPAIAGPALKVFLSKVIPDAKTLELSGPGGESLMKGIEPEKLTALIDYLVSAKKESK